MNGGEVIFHFKGDDKDLDKKTSQLASKLGNIGKSIGGAFLKGTAVATAGITGLVGASVKGFSEMEQLSGGAKKIFDEMDYSIIEKDATEAYKNMNMSAQEYLTAINNIGATFASTMGDQKGYDTAKKGLQAISDYATGTGADINLLSEKYKMITRSTSSYLSIADQFAGLLPQTTDGFLKQAQASGFLSSEYKKLTDVPVDEYQQAITSMLEQGVDKMGLLGNTAAETEKTISGSFLATKSALSNFISGVGNIDEVVSSMTNLGNNVVKAIVEMSPKIAEGLVQMTNALIPQIPALIGKLLPTIINGITALINGIVKIMPQLLEILINVAPLIVQSLSQLLPTISEALLNGLILLSNTLQEQLPVLIPQIVAGVMDLVPKLLDHLPEIINCGIQLLVGLANGIVNAIPILIDKLPQILESLIEGFYTLAPLLLTVGPVLIAKVANGLIKAKPQLLSKIPEIIYAMARGFKNGVGNFLDIGSNLIGGLWQGISNKVDWVVSKIKGMGRRVLNAVKGIFGVHSPSTEFAWVGKMNMVGLKKGMEDMQPELQRSIDSMFDLSPSLYGSASTNLSPQINVVNNISMKQDPLGQMVNDIKTFAGGSKNDYNYGMGG